MKADTMTREVDELIWQVAESGDDQMEAEFLQRYPQHTAALSARKNLVGNFRSARPAAPIATHFAPTRVAARPRYWLAPLAAGLLIGLAAASYQIVKFAQSAPSEPKPTIAIQPQSPIPTPRDHRELTPVPTGESAPDAGVAPRPEPETAEPLVKIAVKGATLFAALDAIQQAGIKIERMPGLEDAPITLTPNSDDGKLTLKPLEMLDAVHQAASFEMVDGGPDGYLILPSDKTTNLNPKAARPVEAGDDGN